MADQSDLMQLYQAAMEQSQWQRLQDMHNRRLSYRQGGAGVAGMSGAQSGQSSPWDEVPGGGSAANAVPHANPFVDERQGYSQLSEDALVNALLGYGVAGASAMAGPTPLSALGVVGGGLYGLGNNAVAGYAGRKARNLGYQGN
jgi:hypothetical protein